MVVSCQVKIISLFTCLSILFLPAFGLADVQPLTDAELDSITVSSLPNDLAESLTNQLEKTLDNSLTSIDNILNSGLLSSGLTQVNANDSTVIIQTNIAFFLQTNGANIHQSNTAFISN